MKPESLIAGMEEHGYRVRVVSAVHIEDVRGALESQHGQGLFDERFFDENLTGFGFSVPEMLPQAKSIIVVGYPDPHVRFAFNWAGERIPVTVPSTYLHFIERDKRAQEMLEALLAPKGYRVAEARLPKKLLAVHSGLARYGRNNITYAGRMGSLYRLVVFFSDLPCEAGPWEEPAQLERCEGCAACISACPTGAIDPERFLIRAERCITFWNEQPKGVPFPGWLDPGWHNCLVGCLYCQQVCPENREVSDFYEEGEEFSEEETRLLLDGGEETDLPAALREKLERADLLEALDTFPRNLGVLLKRPSRQGGGGQPHA
jgi:epoxyqueuosine reductase